MPTVTGLRVMNHCLNAICKILVLICSAENKNKKNSRYLHFPYEFTYKSPIILYRSGYRCKKNQDR